MLITMTKHHEIKSVWPSDFYKCGKRIEHIDLKNLVSHPTDHLCSVHQRHRKPAIALKCLRSKNSVRGKGKKTSSSPSMILMLMLMLMLMLILMLMLMLMLTMARQGDGEDELDLGKHGRHILFQLRRPQLSRSPLFLHRTSFKSFRLNTNFNRTPSLFDKTLSLQIT